MTFFLTDVERLVRKNAIISDMNSSLIQRPNKAHPRRPAGVDTVIRQEMTNSRSGQVFSPNDFAHLGSRTAVDKALSRLANAGHIRRVARGLYDLPREHKIIGTLLPSPDEVAKAVAGKESLRLQPSGAYAANLLGLTEQVPLKLAFLTDGTSRTLKIGRQTVVLKRTTPRNMATAGRISGLVIQALRHLKQEHVDEQVVARLNAKLTQEDKLVLLKDKHHAPAWIAKLIERIAQEAV
jgi:hypothetical protein